MPRTMAETWPLDLRKRIYAAYAAAPRSERAAVLKEHGLPAGKKGTDMMNTWRKFIDKHEARPPSPAQARLSLGGGEVVPKSRRSGKIGALPRYSIEEKVKILEEYQAADAPGRRLVRSKYHVNSGDLHSWRISKALQDTPVARRSKGEQSSSSSSFGGEEEREPPVKKRPKSHANGVCSKCGAPPKDVRDAQAALLKMAMRAGTLKTVLAQLFVDGQTEED